MNRRIATGELAMKFNASLMCIVEALHRSGITAKLDVHVLCSLGKRTKSSGEMRFLGILNEKSRL